MVLVAHSSSSSPTRFEQNNRTALGHKNGAAIEHNNGTADRQNNGTDSDTNIDRWIGLCPDISPSIMANR